MIKRIFLIVMLLLCIGCSAKPALNPTSTPIQEQALVRTATVVPATLTSTIVSATAIPSPTITSSPTPLPQVRLAFVGDVMLARSIGKRINNNGSKQIFAGVRDQLRSADVAIANLECAIAENGVPADKAYRFLAPPAAVDALTDGGIDLVSLANNHALDWGETALFETQHHLNDAQILSVGAGKNADQAYAPVIIERNGLKLAFLAYVNVPVEIGGFDTQTWSATADQSGMAWATPEQITHDVALIKPKVDHVIVLLHSGYEGQTTPNDVQRTNANAALDAGATLVIGAHPHVLQGSEQGESGQLIAWSLGNFVFDGFEGTPSVESAVLQITLDQRGVQTVDWLPVQIVDGVPLIE